MRILRKYTALLLITAGFVNFSFASSTPLQNRWNKQSHTLARFYPERPISEIQLFDDYSDILGLSLPHLDLQLSFINASPAGTHKHYIQLYKNIPVKNSEIVVSLDHSGNVTSVFNGIIPIVKDFSVSPALSQSQSQTIALRNIDQTSLRAQELHRLIIIPEGNNTRLAWEWRIPASEPYGDWEIIIDAMTGEEISRIDKRVFIDGSGQAFLPDPKTAIESDTLLDHNDANWAIPAQCYSTVDLLDLNNPVGGLYYLSGPFCTTAPTTNRAAESTPNFNYLRFDDRFEEVNTYYHIDTYQRYIQSLGFLNIINRPFPFNVNGTTEDNSWFSPYAGTITLGSGGVDDGEDADVIIHEYGHAIQYEINPNWGGGHCEAMGEGFGDYIAGTYSLSIDPAFHPWWVFTWDGHNEFWAGRVLNKPYHYPENAGGEVHDSGQLWSAGLMDVWYDVPDVEIWDKLVFQHHYYIGSGSSMEDAANAILLADIELNDMAYRDIIITNFTARGFLDPANLAPQVSLTPLSDTEDTLQIIFPVIAEIVSTCPLDTASLLLHWGVDGIIDHTLPLISTGNDSFAAVITGPFNNNSISYYLSAADIYGGLSFEPETAPAEPFVFYVGPDTVSPQITVLDTLPNTVFKYGCGNVEVSASDNLGLSEVDFFFRTDETEYQSVPMTEIEPGVFTAQAQWSNLQTMHYFYYYISARDNSSNLNHTITEEYFFQVVSTALFDNFESGMDNWTTTESWHLQSSRKFSGDYALNDRNLEGYPSSQELILTLACPWNPAGLTSLHLDYWTWYFMIPQSDTGFVDILTPSLTWETLDTIAGAIAEWEKRTVVLDPYLQTDSIIVRFRTHANMSYPLPALGWYIDDIVLSTQPLVGTDYENSLPERDNLPNFSVSPNPGNADFVFSFNIPASGIVKLNVYDILGHKIAELSDAFYESGLQRLTWHANSPSGIYFCQLDYAGKKYLTKLLLLK